MSEYAVGDLVHEYFATLLGDDDAVNLMRFFAEMDMMNKESQQWNALRIQKTVTGTTGHTYLHKVINAAFKRQDVGQLEMHQLRYDCNYADEVHRRWKLLNLMSRTDIHFQEHLDVVYYPRRAQDLCVDDIGRVRCGLPVCNDRYCMLEIKVDMSVVKSDMYDNKYLKRLAADLREYVRLHQSRVRYICSN